MKTAFPISHFQFPNSGPRSQRAFTMIEIALSLAVIGFALVAIISVLPLGMNVQKENREETIINQDASVFLNAILKGARGLDDLTNYVMAITNSATPFNLNGIPQGPTDVYAYTYTVSTINGTARNPSFPINCGSNIVGVLSTPKYIFRYTRKGEYDGFLSNHVVAYVRSLSGPASDKFPQTNAILQDLGLSYRMISEIVPYWTNYYDPSWIDAGQQGLNANEVTTRSNYLMVARNLQANLHDVRLTFRWPLAKTTNAPGRQVFRTLASGLLTNDPLNGPLFFFQPRTYVKAP
jgi:type II secretory pathway pseudopilin PulG